MSTPLNPAIVRAILGPTNTGKTHYAVERMLGRSSGCIGLPLRLLAREVYDKICRIKHPNQVALITGEEKITPRNAQYYVCTVEAMPLEKRFAFVAIDEIQLMSNFERGHIFTDRLLHARGTEETLFLGAETARSIIRDLLPDCRFETRERFSTLSYAGHTKVTRLPKRSVIIAFSAAEVYALAELIRRQRGGAAVVMGALSPRTRNAQAELFQSGEVDFLIATDAVGMGLNLDTDHVAFASIRKYDGRRRRMLTPMELGQIAGRAGRFRNNGTFGTTGDCPPLDEETVARIEAHEFEPIPRVEWRNSDLNFSSLAALDDSLHQPTPERRLRRVQGCTDELALERLASIPEVVASVAPTRIDAKQAVKRLWDVCQIPDFRNVTIDAHVKLLQDIYRLLITHGGKLPDDFMEKHVSRLDELSGSVDILSTRLAQIRTWTYCANKTSWMYQPGYWIDRTREVEDRLSDALHEGLIARFVDRRTSALLKGIGTGTAMDSSVKDNGEVWVDGHLIGRLDGLKFVPDETGSDVEAKALLATAAQSVGPEIDRRLTSLSGGTHAIFTLSDKGEILWGGKPVGRIASSGTVFNPDAELIGGQLGNTNLQTMATQRMRDYLKAEVTAKLAPLEALKTLSNSDTALPEAKGFAYTLLEGFGSIDRSSQGKLVKALDQDARKQLREVGVFFGQYHVFMRDMLKPKPATLLSLLVAYGAGGDKKPFIPFAGVTSIPNEGELASKNFSKEALALMGFKAAGPRIVRFDILDRLAGLIRQAQSENGSRRFQVMQEMLALLGSNYEDVRGVLTAIGYKSEVVEPKPETETKAEPNSETAETAIPVEQIKSDTAVQGIPPKDDAQPSATDMSTPSGAISDAVVASTSVVGAPPEDLAKAAPETAPAPKPARKQPQPLQVYNPREEDADGNTVELENNEFWFYPMRPKGPAKNSRGNPKRGNKAQHRKGSGGNDSRKKSAPKPAIKPEDSPFAALLALKGKKD
jgi:ATP-dependent RNA helicase SUPV3L1/SUV3